MDGMKKIQGAFLSSIRAPFIQRQKNMNPDLEESIFLIFPGHTFQNPVVHMLCKGFWGQER